MFEILKKLFIVFGVLILYFEENLLVNVNMILEWVNEDDLIELDKLFELNVNMVYGGEMLIFE